MIEETLKLKRFTDRSVSSLFRKDNLIAAGTPESTSAEAGNQTAQPKPDKPEVEGERDGDADIAEEQEDAAAAAAAPVGSGAVDEEGIEEADLSSLDAARLLELRDAVRSGFKGGMGSRQNAPAEWIGTSTS